MTKIETERLLLRPWRDEDLDPYARTCADLETMRFMRTGVMTRRQTAGQIAMIARHWEERGHGLWAVEEKASGMFVGRVGLMYREDWPEGGHKVEVGWLIDRSHRGKGFATEGALASLRWGFEELGEERIISIIRPANYASRRVAEKCGLSFMGKSYWKSPGKAWFWYAVDYPGGRLMP